jgi:anthranilate synthase/aminodeoxychorismate synthase-like glutamine amidotransferase
VGTAYGATVAGAGEIMHGKTSAIEHDGKGVFAGIDSPFEGIRYHSLTILPETLPDSLEVTATTANGTIMGVRHKEYPVEGIQFHPESIMTQFGHELLKNFLEIPSAPVAV